MAEAIGTSPGPLERARADAKERQLAGLKEGTKPRQHQRCERDSPTRKAAADVAEAIGTSPATFERAQEAAKEQQREAIRERDEKGRATTPHQRCEVAPGFRTREEVAAALGLVGLEHERHHGTLAGVEVPAAEVGRRAPLPAGAP